MQDPAPPPDPGLPDELERSVHVPWSPPGDLAGDVRRQLLARRIVLLHGALDGTAAAEAAATLLMLDASGDERIVLRLTGADADLDTALVVVDVIDVLGVPVDVLAGGTVSGGAISLLAVGRHRLLAPHARLVVREPDASVVGRAADIERQIAAHAAQRDRFLTRLAEATRRPIDELAAEWAIGRVLEPADAVTLGYADAVEPERSHRAGGGGASGGTGGA